MSAPAIRVGYLISKYPAVSMTFILREVIALRRHGIEIDVISINEAPPHETLTQVEQAEVARTSYIKTHGVAGALNAMTWLLFHRPLSLFTGIRKAIALGAPDLARALLCLFYLVEAAMVVRWMDQRRLSHLHVHFASQAASVGLLATYLAPITLSLTVHGPDEFFDIPGYFLAAKMERAHFVACISSFTQSQVMRVSEGSQWQKFEVSRLGVDSAEFMPRTSYAAAESVEILCVGRLVPAKGQRILIEAIDRILRSGRQVHLTLVGDGPDRAELETFVRKGSLTERVTFTGGVNQDEIKAFFGRADIFVLASFAEGIPVALMEAMALEIPCIATTINGIPELISDGVDGFLTSPSDVDDIVQVMTRLIDDPMLRQTIGKAGRVRVQQAYELDTNIGHLADIFRKRLAPASRAS